MDEKEEDKIYIIIIFQHGQSSHAPLTFDHESSGARYDREYNRPRRGMVLMSVNQSTAVYGIGPTEMFTQ